MNWKEEFKEEFWDSEISDIDGKTCYYLNDKCEDPSLLIQFISKEVVEKLISEAQAIINKSRTIDEALGMGSNEQTARQQTIVDLHQLRKEWL